jgi:uncharacterized membrane protein YqgA involved in biofilm formation
MFRNFDFPIALLITLTGLTGVFVVFIVIHSFEMSKYIKDHNCVSTDKRTTTYMQSISNGSGGVMFVPTTTVDHFYECEIDGKHGTSFWH